MFVKNLTRIRPKISKSQYSNFNEQTISIAYRLSRGHSVRFEFRLLVFIWDLYFGAWIFPDSIKRAILLITGD